jgi:LmbE family N-acetylglucosaminyl deacetylase
MLSSRPSVSTWENLVGDLVSLIDKIAPTVIIFPHPALDANRDHIFTADAVLEALQRLEDPVADLLLYTNHHVHAEYDPFGPSGDAVTLPPWFSASVTFRSLYSAPLSPGLQREKLFALDAMHDLRAPPELVVGSVPARIVSRMAKAVRDVWRDPARELSYMRRAVRSNELFFAYRGDDRAVLQRWLPAPPRAPVARVRAPAYRAKS